VVFFGGFGQPELDDTWEYGFPHDCASCGDLTGEEAIDGSDLSIFVASFGSQLGQPEFVPCADYDDDGAITFVDYQAWLQCYRESVGDPSARAPSPADLGDVNGDGRIDGLDIQPFVDVLMNSSAAGFRERIYADMNGDGTVDFHDVASVVEKLLQ
jgi:hypothetical protein